MFASITKQIFGSRNDRVIKRLTKTVNKINSLEDAYMAILYPAAIGKPPSFVLFRQGSIAYRQNAGIDRHKTGKITLNDVSYKVRKKLEKGLQPNFLG